MSKSVFVFLLGIAAWAIVGCAYVAFKWAHKALATDYTVECSIGGALVECEGVRR